MSKEQQPNYLEQLQQNNVHLDQLLTKVTQLQMLIIDIEQEIFDSLEREHQLKQQIIQLMGEGISDAETKDTIH